jgi:hypothetical protein
MASLDRQFWVDRGNPLITAATYRDRLALRSVGVRRFAWQRI